MMEFWIVAGLLIAIAVAIAIWPLLMGKRAELDSGISEEGTNIQTFRDQITDLEQQVINGQVSQVDGDRLKLELEKKLADELGQQVEKTSYTILKSKGLALAKVLIIPLVSVPLYFKLGASTELAVTSAMMESNQTPEEMLKSIESWVAAKPENKHALFLLASRYMGMGKLDEAVSTYRKLFQLSSGHPQVGAELAQALFLANDNVITPEIRMLFENTLSREPENTTALGLQGIDAFNESNFSVAIKSWQTALNYERDPVARQSLTAGINRARDFLGEKRVQVKVQVSLSPELKSLPDETRVIVFARAAGGGQPPVAAVPLTVGDLPREVVLDDSSSIMMGGVALSSLAELDIVARISLSGDVMKADYQARAVGVKISENKDVQLVIMPAS